MPRDEQDLHIKIREFGGIRQDVDPNDLPLQPKIYAASGKNFFTEKGILRASNRITRVIGPVAPYTDTPTAHFHIQALHTCKDEATGVTLLLVGVELHSAGDAVLGHDVIYCNPYADPVVWRSALSGATSSFLSTAATSNAVTAANFRFINYRYSSAPYCFLMNGVDPFKMVKIQDYTKGLRVVDVSDPGWWNCTANASTDRVACSGHAFAENEYIYFRSSPPGTCPFNPQVRYQARSVSAGAFDVYTADTGEKVDITTAGANVQIRSLADAANAAPIGRLGILNHERFWIVREGTNELQWSDDMNPVSWAASANAGGMIDLNTWEGDVVQNLVNYMDDIVAIKENIAKRIVGATPETSSAYELFQATGTIAPDGTWYYNGCLYYVTHEGVVRFNGKRTEPFITVEIKDIWVPDNEDAKLCISGEMMYLFANFKDAAGTVSKKILTVDMNTRYVHLWEPVFFEVQLKNIIPNPRFDPPTTGWTFVHGTAAPSEGLMFTGYESPTDDDLWTGSGFLACSPGDKFYVCGKFSLSKTYATRLGIDIIAYASNKSTVLTTWRGLDCHDGSIDANAWYWDSELVTMPESTAYIKFNVIADGMPSAQIPGAVLRADYLVAINLTKDCGPGKEPTKGTMDTFIQTLPNRFVNSSVFAPSSFGQTLVNMDCVLNPMFTSLLPGVSKPELWFGDKDCIYKIEPDEPAAGTDCGSILYVTPQSDMGKADAVKRMLRVYAIGSGGTIRITPIGDGVEADPTDLVLPSTPGEVRGRLSGKGRLFSFKIESFGEPIKLQDLTIFFDADED